MKTAEEIAEKYVRGNHDALTDNQEIKDMAADIEEYALAKVNQARREERGKIKSEMENLKFTAEDMAVFADWYSMNWDIDFKPDAALEQWLEERRKNK